MSKVIKLTENDLRKIVTFVIKEQKEHTRNLFKSWAKNKSGNYEESIKIMDDVLKYQKQLPKKDFQSYDSFEELSNDLKQIISSQRKKDVSKIYEDEDLLVIAANTWEASCKYGSGTKWCTTAKDSPNYYLRHRSEGTEFFWIFKKVPNYDPGHKYSYYIKQEGRIDWCDSTNKCTPDLPENSYPKKHPQYQSIIEKLKEFHDSRNLGEIIEKKQINSKFLFDNIREHFDDLFMDDYNLYFDSVIDELIDTGFNTTILVEGIVDMVLGELERDVELNDDDIDKITDDAEEQVNIVTKKILQEENYIIKEMLYEDFNIDVLSRDLVPVFKIMFVENGFDETGSFEDQMVQRGLTFVDLVNKNKKQIGREIEEVIHEEIEYRFQDVMNEILDEEVIMISDQIIDEYLEK